MELLSTTKDKQRVSAVTSLPKSNILSISSSKIHTLDGLLGNLSAAGYCGGFPLVSFMVSMHMKLSSSRSCISGDAQVTG